MFDRTREKLTAVKDSAEKISENLTAILGLAVLAVALAAGALFVSMRALRAVHA